MIETIGVAGSIIICGSAIPQVIKTYRTRQAQDLSIAYLMTLMIGLVLLQAYCLHVGDLIFIIGNSCSLLMTGLLIYFWFAFKGQPTKPICPDGMTKKRTFSKNRQP